MNTVQIERFASYVRERTTKSNDPHQRTKRWRLAAGMLLVVLVRASSPNHAQQSGMKFVLVDGDRVVFYGDSITNQKLYTTDIEEFVLTRFPQWRVSFFH